MLTITKIGLSLAAVIVVAVVIIVPLAVIKPWDDGDDSVTTTMGPINPTEPATTTTEEPEPYCRARQKAFEAILEEGGDYISYEEIKDGVWPHRYDRFNVTGYYLNVTSTTYLTDQEVTNFVWWHRVIVYIPDQFDDSISDTMYLNNGGGNNRNSDGSNKSPENCRPGTAVNSYVRLAAYTGTVVADMRDNPNQAMIYYEELARNKSRTEDAIIAYSWRHFIEVNEDDFDWLLQIPMNKAIIKVFNAIQDFTKDNHGLNIEKYSISGYSKRGWTSWLAAALDDRVIASLPVVFDLLKCSENLHQHYQSLGGWSFAFSPYYNEDLTKHLDDQLFQEMQCIIDPWDWLYKYQEKNTPIFHTGTTGDEFFMPTDALVYLDDFKQQHESTWIRYLHNTEHTTGAHDLFQDDLYIAHRILYVNAAKNTWQEVIPKITWNSEVNATHGKIHVTTDALSRGYRPDQISINVFAADTKTHNDTDPFGHNRDFRLARHNARGILNPQLIWWDQARVKREAKIETIQEGQEWIVTMKDRTDGVGYRGFYAELEFLIEDEEKFGRFVDGREKSAFTTGTPIVVMPVEMKNDDCSGLGCYGSLV